VEVQASLFENANMNARSSAEFWYGEIWKSVNKCVLCDMREKYVLMELDDVVLTTNIYPYINGALMIVPKRHVTHLKDLTPKEWETVRVLEYVAKKFLRLVFGYKCVWMIYREGGSLGEESQKTVEHLHIHLIPYINGLVNINYQKITYPPRVLAKDFKDNKKFFEDLIKRFQKKYTSSEKRKVKS